MFDVQRYILRRQMFHTVRENSMKCHLFVIITVFSLFRFFVSSIEMCTVRENSVHILYVFNVAYPKKIDSDKPVKQQSQTLSFVIILLTSLCPNDVLKGSLVNHFTM